MLMKNYVVDSNVLILLGQSLKSGKFENARRGREIEKIATLAVDGKIKLIVTPTINQEIMRGTKKDNGDARLVILRFCQLKNFSSEESEKINNLAKLFIERNAISRLEDKKFRGIPKDAIIMAEACFAGYPLLTNNDRHFCNYWQINDACKMLGLKGGQQVFSLKRQLITDCDF